MSSLRWSGLLSILCLMLTAFAASATVRSQASTAQRVAHHLMPAPAKISHGAGYLQLDSSFRVASVGYSEPRLEAAIQRSLRRLVKLTGVPLETQPLPQSGQARLVVSCRGAGEAVQTVGADESYTFEVTSQQATLEAPTPLGILRGLETFLQLVEMNADGFQIPVVRIEDRPRFPWRGLLIDVCRHWQPAEVIKRNLDAMAAVKLNVLHWHLSEDQGFRVESKNFPRLHEQGSDGDYYTQEQVREIIAYARDRGIRVVPEFDMPGHTTAWFVGHPELASAPGPYQIERHYGIFDPAMDPTREEVYAFLDTFIGEMAALFPDQYFHIGGDEVNGKQWNRNPRIQAFMREKGLKSNHDLQAHFNQRLLAIVQKHGKKMVGWDEILHPALPKDSIIQSWRGQRSLAQAAEQGYMGILSNGYYVDLILPASLHYLVDPLKKETARLTDEQRARILGGEACMWSEFTTPETIDSRLWPRTAAIAERLWSPAEVTDVGDMYRRLEIVSRRLSLVGVTHRSSFPLMLERLAGPNGTEPVRILSEVLEPVKNYTRPGTREYTSRTPMNRLVDATRPESDKARLFSRMVDQVVSGASAAERTRAEMREWLTIWRENHSAFQAMLPTAPMLKEAEGLSVTLSALSVAGLQSLEYLAAGKKAPADWQKQQTELLQRAARPQAELLIMIVPAIQKLVQAVK